MGRPTGGKRGRPSKADIAAREAMAEAARKQIPLREKVEALNGRTDAGRGIPQLPIHGRTHKDAVPVGCSRKGGQREGQTRKQWMA